jgi:hypothetical protein
LQGFRVSQATGIGSGSGTEKVLVQQQVAWSVDFVREHEETIFDQASSFPSAKTKILPVF